MARYSKSVSYLLYGLINRLLTWPLSVTNTWIYACGS